MTGISSSPRSEHGESGQFDAVPKPVLFTRHRRPISFRAGGNFASLILLGSVLAVAMVGNPVAGQISSSPTMVPSTTLTAPYYNASIRTWWNQTSNLTGCASDRALGPTFFNNSTGHGELGFDMRQTGACNSPSSTRGAFLGAGVDVVIPIRVHSKDVRLSQVWTFNETGYARLKPGVCTPLSNASGQRCDADVNVLVATQPFLDDLSSGASWSLQKRGTWALTATGDSSCWYNASSQTAPCGSFLYYSSHFTHSRRTVDFVIDATNVHPSDRFALEMYVGLTAYMDFSTNNAKLTGSLVSFGINIIHGGSGIVLDSVVVG